jgi:hypothetical protein
LDQVPEKLMHWIRWGLATSWILLIVSLFYDPISLALTDAANLSSPVRIHPDLCILLQGNCIPQTPYSLGVRIFWSAIVPAAIFIIFVFGHETWRRICPLSFVSQLARALKIQRQRKTVNAGIVSYELVTISEDSWLGKNHFYLQFGLLFLGLTARLLLINSNPLALGIFLISTILSAILVGFLYAGKSWCNYFCPFAPVQAIFTGPRGLFGSRSLAAAPSSVPQSMCRTIDNQSACVGCKSTCIDIDAEQTYWETLEQPARRFVQYGYVGLLVGFFLYFYLFAGNWDYYFSGMWSRDDAMGTLFSPGFYLFDRSIVLPKIIAVPLTLGLFTIIADLLLDRVEKVYRGYLRSRGILNARQRSHHTIFTLITVFSFWFFFSFAGRPIINTMPPVIVLSFNAIAIVVGSIWGYRTLGQTSAEDLASEPTVVTTEANDFVPEAPLPSHPDLVNSNSTLTKFGKNIRPEITQTRRKS